MGEKSFNNVYHKSGYENAVKSIMWQSFYPSVGSRHWLGDGIYFWQYYKDAVWWDGKYKEPVILAVDLVCNEDQFLDLDDCNALKAFYEYFQSAFEILKNEGIDLYLDSNELVNGASCNYYKIKFNLQLIRYSFPNNSKRPQFCASNNDIVSNIRKASAEIGSTMEEKSNVYI